LPFSCRERGKGGGAAAARRRRGRGRGRGGVRLRTHVLLPKSEQQCQIAGRRGALGGRPELAQRCRIWVRLKRHAKMETETQNPTTPL
jgi:hypothetical protein